MKKLMLLVIAVVTVITVTNAQEVGVRFGNVSGGNVAIDGVFSTGKFSRIHADVSFGSGVGIDVLWDFAYRPIDGEAFNWYAGVGPYVIIDSPFSLGAMGELGLEYRFNGLPIVIGADWRPAFRIIENTGFSVDSFGLNIRWDFGS